MRIPNRTMIDDASSTEAQVRHYRRLLESCQRTGIRLYVNSSAVKVECDGRFRGLDITQQQRVINGWNPFAPKVPSPQ